MPSMWLADFTLDLLTVRVCFRKYLLIFGELGKKKNILLRQTSCPVGKIKLTSCAKLRSFLPFSGRACWMLQGRAHPGELQPPRKRRGVVRAVPGKELAVLGNTMSCVVDGAFVNTASCFHVNTVESFSSGDFLVCWYTEHLLPLLSGTDAGWTKSTCGSKEGVFMLLSQPSRYFSGSGCSARYSRTALVTTAAWKRETSPCQVTQSTLWLQSTPLLLQAVLWTSENILRGAIKKCRGTPEKHHFFLRLCLGAEHLGSLKATDG